MPGRNRRKQEAWQVTVVPAGTLEEAEAVSRRVSRMVAGWVLREPSAEGEEANG